MTRLRQNLPLILIITLVALSSVTRIDQYAEQQYENLFQRALVTFALARTLNGVISAVQGTEVALQPAGVGVTLTPGQILDPVNDLVERFSWIMLGASLSLGVQQVMLDIGQWWGVRLLVVLLAVYWLWRRSRGEPDATALALRMLLVVLLLRFAVPATLLANEAVYALFLESRYLESTQQIETAGAEIEAAGSRPLASEQGESEDNGLMDTLNRALESTRDTLDIRDRLDTVSERAADLVEHLLQLSVVFILQTGILPLAFLWMLLQLLKRCGHWVNSRKNI